MILNASCQLNYQISANVPVIFMLRPQSGEAQSVLHEQFTLSPQVPVAEFTDGYGNLCQRIIMPAGTFQVSAQCKVQVADSIDVHPDAAFTPVEQLPTEVIQFLLPSRYCQSDRLLDFGKSVVGNLPPGYQQARAIHDWVQREIRYVIDSSNTSTSALETAQSRCGVCRDFAHLGIALCRAMSIPARMVVGFLHELEPMDLHAWFEAFIGGRWYTFDATQAQTKGNRIVIAYGRDAADVALATIFGAFWLTHMQVTVTAEAGS
jgi:transglutaminase-like putative cysteine protease